MRIRFWRRRPAPPQPPRPDRLAIALLEHDIYGVQPEPGTAAAAALGLQALATAGLRVSDFATRPDDSAAPDTPPGAY
jgi:hypothetical protein